MEIFTLKITEELDTYTLKSLLALIDMRKQIKLLKFFVQKDLQRSLFADLLIRKYIIEKFKIPNNSISFSLNSFGKPYYNLINNFHFNVSHSGDWVTCAFDDKPVGLDIEKICSINLDIAKNIFSNKENKAMLLNNDPLDYFFTLWTLKESYVKFIGEGLSHPLSSFSIRFFHNDKIWLEIDNRRIENIYFQQIKLENNYKLAVCSLKSALTDKVHLYDINDILYTFI